MDFHTRELAPPALKKIRNMNHIIGIDFDNTIISYDELMYKTSLDRKLIPSECAKNKNIIRRMIRTLPDGEISWQKIQAMVYGPEIKQAEMFNGVRSFFKACKSTRTPIFIVSHKTEYAAQNTEGINLREAALDWMEDHHFFIPEGLGITRKQVYFEPTRKQKISRIKKLGCTHFIDDLIETFLDPSFPENIKKILFSSLAPDVFWPDVKTVVSWQEIHNVFF